jgi:hypothetical protein
VGGAVGEMSVLNAGCEYTTKAQALLQTLVAKMAAVDNESKR